MNKKISIGATIALMIISIALTISVTMVVAMRIFNSSVNDVTQRRAMYQYVTEIDTAVRPHYLGTIDEEKLRTALAQGYVDGIGDPYAAYLSASEYKAVEVHPKDRMRISRSGCSQDHLILPSNRHVRTCYIHQHSRNR